MTSKCLPCLKCIHSCLLAPLLGPACFYYFSCATTSQTLKHRPASNKVHLIAAGITSTANDMAQWMKMLMRGGLNDAGEQVFQNDVILETQMPVNPYTYTEPDVDPFLPPKYESIPQKSCNSVAL